MTPDDFATPVFDGPQMRHVIELLELMDFAPHEARRQLDRLARERVLTAAQRASIEHLFTRPLHEVDRLLRAACADDEARDALREERVHEARGIYLVDARPARAARGASAGAHAA
ncbi:MAG: hypothetical protein REJ24_18385 [Rhodocyclaceae bacterium]|nr:hypothetical protein [Rhodocyclaceae bacterium]MDQ8019769.1 hypothetical protein [Pseudomonadota bacterium]